MFSSLEALDAEDTPNAALVVRQGAFQPKAKPRARKGSVAAVRKPPSLSAATTSFTNQEADVHEADLTGGGKPSGEVARNSTITVFESQGRNPLVTVAEVSDSPIRVVLEAQNPVASRGEDPSTGASVSAHAVSVSDGVTEAVQFTVAEVSDSPMQVVLEAQNPVASCGEDPSTGASGSAHAVSVSAGVTEAVQFTEAANDYNETLEEALAKTLKAVKEKKKRGANQATEISDVEKTLSNTSGISKKSKQAAMCAESVSPSASLSRAEAANENSGTVESVHKELLCNSSNTSKKKKRTSNDCEEHDTAEMVSSDVALASPSREAAKRTRRKPARFNDGANDDLIRASIDLSSEPFKEIQRLSIQSNVRDDDAEDDFLIAFVQEKKLKKSKTASFNATVVQPATDIGVRDNDTGKATLLTTEEGERKKFRKTLPSRRRVERRAMNPANPDLDPKKMTMKDIIRLAEAKEKLVKNDNTEKAKDEKEARTTNEIDKEDENSERTCFAPQVQFVDGQIVLNEESLTVSAHPKDDIRTYKRVEETHSKLNYHSYVKRTPKTRWRKDETELFYEALREFGTNFSMIQHLFPGRTRKQVLLKYKKEEKTCPLRISEAMRLKPCETSHFLEVMSSMNVLPSETPEIETPDTSANDRHFDLFGTTPCRQKNQELVGDNSSVAARMEQCLENDGTKAEETPTPRKDEGRQDDDSRDPCEREAVTACKPEDNQSQDAPKNEEKPVESPTKASNPRKKKSLFSYQTVTLKS